MKSFRSVCIALSLACVSACAVPPVKQAEDLMEAHRYEDAIQLLKGYLNADGDPALQARARALQAEALFYVDGPIAAIDALRTLKTEDSREYDNIIARLLPYFEALDQHIQGQSVLEEAQMPHPWFKERAQWSSTLRQQGLPLDTLAKQVESPLVQQLVQWEQARLKPEAFADLLSSYPESAFRPAWYQAYLDYLLKEEDNKGAENLLVKWKNELDPLDPLRATVLLKQAELATDKQPRAALAYYRNYLQAYPLHPEGRATIYKLQSDFKDQLTAGDHDFLAKAAFDRYMYQTAYKEISVNASNTAQELLQQGEYALKAKYYAQAVSHFEDLRERYPATTEAGLASVYLAQHQRRAKAYGAALNQLQAVHLAYNSNPEVNAAALWEEGIIYDLMNKDDQRARVYHQLVEVNPDFEEAMPALWYAVWHDFVNKDYEAVITALTRHEKHYADHELKSRFMYWLARAYEETDAFDKAQTLYEALSKNPLMDYYTHRAKARLHLIKKGGEDRYAAVPYEGLSVGTEQSPLPQPSYAQAFKQALDGDEQAFSPLMELYYLQQYVPFMEIAEHHIEPQVQVLNGLLMQKQERYYEAVTRYRYLAAKDDTYLPAAFPLAYFEKIEAEAKKYQMNPFLPAGLIWQESQYNPGIKSWVGATGLMQIMPATGNQIAQSLDMGKDYSLSNPMDNIKMGVWYLDSRHDVFDGNSLLAVASYNAGAGPVNRWLKDFGHLPLDALAESITYPETRGYVKRVFTSYWIYQHLYGKNSGLQ